MPATAAAGAPAPFVTGRAEGAGTFVLAREPASRWMPERFCRPGLDEAARAGRVAPVLEPFRDAVDRVVEARRRPGGLPVPAVSKARPRAGEA